jgi:hypothetical protein
LYAHDVWRWRLPCDVRGIERARRLLVAPMDPIGLLQWPAMVVTLVAAGLVASKRRVRRRWGFAMFILSNVLWIVWGWHTASYALITLQIGLFFMNQRGERQNADVLADASARSGKRASLRSVIPVPVRALPRDKT